MDLTEGSLTELLPTELCVEILKNLDIKDVLAMSLTCHKWNDIVNNTDILWKRLAETHCFQLSKCEAADKSKPVWKVSTSLGGGGGAFFRCRFESFTSLQYGWFHFHYEWPSSMNFGRANYRMEAITACVGFILGLF